MKNSYFKADLMAMEDSAEKFSDIGKSLRQMEKNIILISNSLGKNNNFDYIKNKLRQLSAQLETETEKLFLLRQTLISVEDIYRTTEKRLSGDIYGINIQYQQDNDLSDGQDNLWNWAILFQEYIKNWFGRITGSENEIDSIVFDDKGKYGGDQGAPKSLWLSKAERAELYNIVKKYYPNMSEKEFGAYMKKLNSEGCGYVAVINTIFAAFEGKSEVFEEKFGFPMYGENNDLNYNRLLVDLYAATDNHNALSSGTDSINYYEDRGQDESGKSYNFRMDKTGKGTSQESREYRTKLYLKDKEVNVRITNYTDVTVENFGELSKNGYCVVSYHYGNLQNKDGSTAAYINGGHAMVVTGVTDDGRFIVSSWGKKYYIDPAQILTQTDSNGKSYTTSISFQYFQYDL